MRQSLPQRRFRRRDRIFVGCIRIGCIGDV